MLTDRLLLILKAFTFKALVPSLLTEVNVKVVSLTVPHLIMAEREDARMRLGLLARHERFIERKNAFGLEAFGLLPGEFGLHHLLAHLPKSLGMTEGLPKREELPQEQQPEERRRAKKDAQLQDTITGRGNGVSQEEDDDRDEQGRQHGLPQGQFRRW